MQALGEKFRANPRDPDTAIRYARALRATGQRTQAAAVLETAALHNPNNRPLLGAYGRALADSGSFKQALDVLERAHSPDQPDWRVLSVQGAVLDQMGRHEEAQRYYASALKIMPDEPSVMSNLGLSYALSKDLKRAEETLRHASAKGSTDKRVRQNLALVVGPAGALPGGRDDREGRSAAGRGHRKCRHAAAHAGAEGRHRHEFEEDDPAARRRGARPGGRRRVVSLRPQIGSTVVCLTICMMSVER